MGPRDTFYFNERRYRDHCNEIAGCKDLIQKHHQKVRAMSALTVSGSAGVALAYLTTGISLIGTAYSLRQFHILYQQMRIIEDDLEKRGHADMPKTRLKDIIIGLLIGAASYAAGFGVAVGLEHLVAPVMDGLSTASAGILQSQLSQAVMDIHATGFTHAAGVAGHVHHFSLHQAAKGFGHAIQHAAHEVHGFAHEAKEAVFHAAHEVHVVAHEAKMAFYHTAHEAKAAMQHTHIAHEASAVVHHPRATEHGLVQGLRESFGGLGNGAVSLPPSSTGSALASVTSQIFAIGVAHAGEHILATQIVSFAGERFARLEKSPRDEVKTSAKELKENKEKTALQNTEPKDSPRCDCLAKDQLHNRSGREARLGP
ncbi:hypothetical protein HWV62_34307 [Athelia sp. TMB]|nr:hypothetical protein HWV62_34307 [Athelia sp. TMB]